jgi:hypothetical protein
VEKAERIDSFSPQIFHIEANRFELLARDKKVRPQHLHCSPTPTSFISGCDTVKMQHNPDFKADLREPSETDDHVTAGQLEKLETGGLAPWSTHIAGDAANLSPEHRDYLLKRHGTLELDPMPGFGDADPLNWKTWKVR